MGREVIIRIHTPEGTIETHTVKTDAAHPALAGKTVHIKAHSNVNYELIEKAGGYAPENIVVKRVGKDLYIAFEGSDIDDPDVIIDAYYNESEESIVGEAENGLYYEYVPESAELVETLSDLKNGIAAGQALGGEGSSSAMPEDGGISTLTWVGALLGVGAVAGLAGGGGSSNPDTPGPSGEDNTVSREDFEKAYDGAVKEGDAGGNTLLGSNNADRLYGHEGDDILTGLGGDDLLAVEKEMIRWTAVPVQTCSSGGVVPILFPEGTGMISSSMICWIRLTAVQASTAFIWRAGGSLWILPTMISKYAI
jgi:hypothetical protein